MFLFSSINFDLSPTTSASLARSKINVSTLFSSIISFTITIALSEEIPTLSDFDFTSRSAGINH